MVLALVLQHLKNLFLFGLQLDVEGLYQREGELPLEVLRERVVQSSETSADVAAQSTAAMLAGVVWTRSMRRMYTLLDRCPSNAACPLPFHTILAFLIHLPCETVLCSVADM